MFSNALVSFLSQHETTKVAWVPGGTMKETLTTCTRTHDYKAATVEGWKCSKCGEEFVHIGAPRYCPECGAKFDPGPK